MRRRATRPDSSAYSCNRPHRLEVSYAMTTPVQPGQLRVSIEMGDGYQPSDRLRAAIEDLRAALAETEDAEVEGFVHLENLAGARVLSFTHEHVEHFGARKPIAGALTPPMK